MAVEFVVPNSLFLVKKGFEMLSKPVILVTID